MATRSPNRVAGLVVAAILLVFWLNLSANNPTKSPSPSEAPGPTKSSERKIRRKTDAPEVIPEHATEEETHTTHVVGTKAQREGYEESDGQKKAPQLEAHTRQVLNQVLKECNSDGLLNVGHKQVSCILCEDAVISAEEVYCPTADHASGLSATATATNKAAYVALNGQEKFPPIKGAGTRHHLKVMPVRFSKPPRALIEKGIEQGPTLVGYYQTPVSGGNFMNVWHTVADFALMMYHTIHPIVEYQSRQAVLDLLGIVAKEQHDGAGADTPTPPLMTWLTRSALMQFGKERGKACFDKKSCGSLPLFDLIRRMAGGSSMVLSGSTRPQRYKFLLLGLNTRCSPIPADPPTINTPQCHQQVYNLRQRLLTVYDLPLKRRVKDTKGETECPTVHVMSRQRDRYRRMSPWKETVEALRDVYAKELNCPASKINIVKLSTAVSMRDQIESVANSSILLAGRGGGTTLAIFLPDKGGYLSVSGFDRWNPFRDLYPPWYVTEHEKVELVHHENSEKPPQRFGSGSKSYIDPNRAGYKVEPDSMAKALKTMVLGMRRKAEEGGTEDRGWDLTPSGIKCLNPGATDSVDPFFDFNNKASANAHC